MKSVPPAEAARRQIVLDALDRFRSSSALYLEAEKYSLVQVVAIEAATPKLTVHVTLVSAPGLCNTRRDSWQVSGEWSHWSFRRNLQEWDLLNIGTLYFDPGMIDAVTAFGEVAPCETYDRAQHLPIADCIRQYRQSVTPAAPVITPDEQAWLLCDDPAKMLELLRGKASNRKTRLFAVAAFRWGTLRPAGVRLELAERLADGAVTTDELQALQPGRESGLELDLLSEDLPTDILRGLLDSAVQHLEDAVRSLLDDCALTAWRGAHQVAWEHWREEVKHHPLLSDARRVRELVSEERQDRFDAIWLLAFKMQYNANIWTYARKELGADESHSEEWDARWEKAWRSAWESAWRDGCGQPWTAPYAATWSETLQVAVDALREKAWESGPWDQSDGPFGIPEPFEQCHIRTIVRAENRRQEWLLRDIFGNPYRPVMVEPSWLTSEVVDLARAIYEERAFDQLPFLGNALERAGCVNSDVLSHCRGYALHCRGCWVVDLILGNK